MPSKIFIRLSLYAFLAAMPVQADVIVMRNGERFTTSAVREEQDKILFDMQGLVVSVEKREIVAVIRSDGVSFTPARDESRPVPPTAAKVTEQLEPLKKIVEENLPVSPVPQENRRNSSIAPIHAPAAGRDATREISPDAPGGRHQRMDLDGIFWGMSSEALPGLKKIKTEPLFGGVDHYWRPGQPLIYGSAPLDGWVFGFWEDQLYAMVMWTNGRAGYDRMKNEIFHLHGRGTRSPSHEERYVWVAEDTQHMLEFDANLNTGLMVMRSSRVDARIKQLYP
jgi:hypothetical protein